MGKHSFSFEHNNKWQKLHSTAAVVNERETKGSMGERELAALSAALHCIALCARPFVCTVYDVRWTIQIEIEILNTKPENGFSFAKYELCARCCVFCAIYFLPHICRFSKLICHLRALHFMCMFSTSFAHIILALGYWMRCKVVHELENEANSIPPLTHQSLKHISDLKRFELHSLDSLLMCVCPLYVFYYYLHFFLWIDKLIYSL